MKIGIDARLIGETGVGRYIRNLITELALLDNEDEYVVFFQSRDIEKFVPPNKRWSARAAEAPWHSISEQFVMPWLFMREHIDLVHVPYFNVPIFYPGKYIMTIHDLTILHFDTGKASTLPYWLYKIRRIGYRVILFLGTKRASHILTVSQTVKKDIMASFGEKDHRISVIYEGIDPYFLKPLYSKQAKIPVDGDFFLYVGNVYPHKNIDTLLESYILYKNTVRNPAKLVFVGPSDYFYSQLEEILPSIGLESQVRVLHRIDDQQLRLLYAKSIALVFPSRMEGFGLPALEALASGCRVICTDIPIFHEILGSHATFVDTTTPEHLVKAMKLVSQKIHTPESYKKILRPFLSKYSWKKMAETTYTMYKKFGQQL